MRKNDTRYMGQRSFEMVLEDARRHWEGVPAISCPTLVVRGANSDVLGAKEAAGLAQAFSDGRWVEVPDAGHTVQGDNPAGLVTVIRNFLTDVGIATRKGGEG